MSTTGSRLAVHRRTVLYLSKLFFLALGSLPAAWAAPFRTFASTGHTQHVHHQEPDDPALWLDLAVAVLLVLLGGVFAGLTIALMGQDEINLQVVSKSGIGAERRHAGRVLRLIKRGKHWVLVTLLLSNVITNETLPIILDRSLGGGWPAVVGSTVAIVIFGEIIPQSVCVRYGLAIGAWMSPFVLILMYIESPIAWPTAKLLDRLIGEEHGTTYSKAGLKTLVTIHKTFGDAGERLNEDEVTIIGAVLELKNKPLGSIMTPMDDVFTMSLDTILDEKTMEAILSAGYSRIPIHAPDEPSNFVGMLLVKMLITYDPEDARPVGDFALATLPETAPETSCLDILNFFQEGKSHMVLVSENPGENEGAVGVLTLEDVIEELIGEEIIDESDVFVDVHKAIRRLAPAPRSRLRYNAARKEYSATLSRDGSVSEFDTRHGDSLLPPISETRDQTLDVKPREPTISFAASPKHTTFLVRRRSSGVDGASRETITKRTDSPELRQHLKHLGPSNLASRPRTTRFTNVKIKPGASDAKTGAAPGHTRSSSLTHSTGGVGEGLLRDAGIDARDGVQALHQGYGTIENRPLSARSRDREDRARDAHSPAASDRSTSTLHSLPERDEDRPRINRNRTPRGTTRSGSITENIVEYNGFRKVVLDISSSSDEAAAGRSEGQDSKQGNSNGVTGQNAGSDHAQGADIKKKKKKKKKKAKSKSGDAGEGDEDRPLLD